MKYGLLAGIVLLALAVVRYDTPATPSPELPRSNAPAREQGRHLRTFSPRPTTVVPVWPSPTASERLEWKPVAGAAALYVLELTDWAARHHLDDTEVQQVMRAVADARANWLAAQQAYIDEGMEWRPSIDAETLRNEYVRVVTGDEARIELYERIWAITEDEVAVASFDAEFGVVIMAYLGHELVQSVTK